MATYNLEASRLTPYATLSLRSAVKDPTSDMAVFCKQGSKVVGMPSLEGILHQGRDRWGRETLKILSNIEQQ